jgi:hypothetical protein
VPPVKKRSVCPSGVSAPAKLALLMVASRSGVPVPSAACQYSCGKTLSCDDDQTMRRPSGVQIGAMSSDLALVSAPRPIDQIQMSLASSRISSAICSPSGERRASA